MTTATMYVDDLEQSAACFADTEGMSDADKRDVLDAVCDALSQRTGYDVDWSNEYSPNGWVINGVSHFDGDDSEGVMAATLNLEIEHIVNDPAYTGPASL